MTFPRSFWLAVGLLGACTAGTRPDAPAVTTGSGASAHSSSPGSSASPALGAAPLVDAAPLLDARAAVDAGTVDAPSAPPSGCPTSLAAATGTCTPPSLSCRYPQGACLCALPVHCGGDAPPEGFDAQPARWSCRTDGCPSSAPLDGTACPRAGKRCDYTCACVQIAECTKSGWKSTHGPCKP